MSAHTKEPWTVVIRGQGGDRFAQVVYDKAGGKGKPRIAFQLAPMVVGELEELHDAVECRNAIRCAGIENPAAIPEAISALQNVVRTTSITRLTGPARKALDALNGNVPEPEHNEAVHCRHCGKEITDAEHDDNGGICGECADALNGRR